MEPKQAARPEPRAWGALEENPRPSRSTESRRRGPSRLDGRLPFGLALVLLAGVAVWAMDSSYFGVVDGWPIGNEVNCSLEQRCDELLTAARTGLASRNPGHAEVVKQTLHEEGTHGNVLTTRSGGCCWVARFRLADGSVRAIGVGYPGISTEPATVDYGP